MSAIVTRTAFILDQFVVPSAGQQLLDRFLIGFNSASRGFVRSKERFGNSTAQEHAVSLHLLQGSPGPELKARERDYGLRLVNSLPDLVQSGRVFIAFDGARADAVQKYEQIFSAMAKQAPDKRCFAYGLLDHSSAGEVIQRAARHGLSLEGASEAAYLMTLPQVDFTTDWKKALVVAQGPFPKAEARALEALFSAVSGDAVRSKAIQSATPLSGESLWQSTYSAQWLPLFSAAVSRSNTIQGDPEKDGRTQDIVGLHLVEKLATRARGWIVQFENGPAVAVLVLDGALADMNFAVEKANGSLRSAQLYNPPSPMQDAFSGMAEKLLDSAAHKSNLRLIARALEKMQPPA